MSDIAYLYDVTVDEILGLNPDVDPELIRPGQVLQIPAETLAAGSSTSGEGGGSGSTQGGFVVHIVSLGETLSSIAAQYDISVSVIRAANDLSTGDETIRPEQSLVIPLSSPTPTTTATADPHGTSTPVPPYPSPLLLCPPDGAVLTDEAPVLLQWASVGVLEDDEWYELSLWQPAGGVVSSTVHLRATAWRVPFELLENAEDDSSTFHWRVQVVREAAEQVYDDAGDPSAAHAFVWEGPGPTQIPSVTSTP